jgi:hypothetical protein
MISIQTSHRTQSFAQKCSLIRCIIITASFLTLHPDSGELLADAEKNRPTPQENSSDLKVVPPDALGFVTIRVADLWTSDIAKPLRQRVLKEKTEELEKLEDYGLTVAGIERLTYVARSNFTQYLMVVTASKPYSSKKVLRSLGAEEEIKKDEEKKFYEGRGLGLHALSDHTFVMGTAEGVKDFIDRSGQKADSSMPAAWRLASEKHHVFVGVNPSKVAKAAGMPVPPAFQPLLQSQSAALTLDFGIETSAKMHISFPKVDQARDGEKAIKAGLDLGQSVLANFLDKQLDPEGEAETPYICDLLKKLSDALKKVSVEAKETTVEARLQVKLYAATASGVLAELSRVNEGYSTGATFAVNGQQPKDPTQSNLQQLAQAMLKYHKDHGHLPANAIYSKKGEPLLSWRVELLPYLDHEEMYKRFKLDEPWNGPHNIKLIDKMPEVFNDWGASRVNKLKATRFRVFSGKGTAFEGTQGLRLTDFTDGSATTFLIVLAQMPVPWTKPDLLPYLPNRPLCKLGGGARDNGFYAACADGSVHLIKEKTDEKTIRALITRNGSEKVRLPDEP